MPADRSRRRQTWASAVARDPGDPGTSGSLGGGWAVHGAGPVARPGSERSAGGQSADGTAPVPVGGSWVERGTGAGFAEIARRELGELVSAGREVVVERLAELGHGDPARKHGKRIRRARRRLRAEATAATGLAGLTAAAVATSAPEVAEVGLGAGALLLGAAAVRAGRRLADLRRQPVPPARAPRPPKDSPARGPLDRLAAQERALHALLGHLGEAAVEPRRVAAAAAAGLRELGARLTAVDTAHRLSGELADAVEALRRQLHAGIASYDALVVAAADAVAADAGLRTPASSLQEATDALAALAAGLRAVA